MRRGCRRIYHVPAALLVPPLLVAGLSVQAQGDKATAAQEATRAPIPGATDPRVTQDTIHTTICVKGYTATVRPSVAWARAYKHHLMDKAGIPWGTRFQFELDHAQPLETGGAPQAPDNLWLQKIAEARVKDAEETRLHREVCAGRMSLKAAQDTIAAHWLKTK